MHKQWHVILLISVFVWSISACGPQSDSVGDPQAWVDAPLDGTQLPLAPYEIVAHADDPSGISQFEFSINGAVLATIAGSSGSLSTARQMWNPTAPGDYVISVRALSASGGWGPQALVHVTIGETPAETPLALTATLPALTLTPLSAPIFELTKNANCRVGPNQVFNEIGAAFAGDSVPIEGKNEDSSWWLVRLPNGTLCWVSGTTGNANGNLGNVPFVQGPPTPIPPEPTQTPQEGCFVFDPNQQPVCTVPCPENAQPGGACTP